jgi:hypothetical protein
MAAREIATHYDPGSDRTTILINLGHDTQGPDEQIDLLGLYHLNSADFVL